MKSILLFVSLVWCSLSFGQIDPSVRYCIDVVKSENGKYYALYSDNTWEESTYATAEVIRAINNRKNPPAKNSVAANTYGIASASPAKTMSSQSRASSTRKSTSRTYIRGKGGGCYYINSNGGKTYVDRSMCD